MKKLLIVGLVSLWALFLAPANAKADTLTFFLNSAPFSGNDPAGNWTVTLTDVVGGVEVKIETTTSVASEFLSELYLNFDPSLAIASLSGTYVSGAEANAFGTMASDSQIGTDCCKADGDGFYDVFLNYSGSTGVGPGGSATTSTYLFAYTGAGTFDVNSFDFMSTPASGEGNAGPFSVAAHIQGLANGQSGWITETTDTPTTTDEPTTTDQPTTGGPEPASVLLLGMGMVFAGRRLRRRVG